MPGAAAGNGIGASGLLPELPLPDAANALQPHWNDAVQVAITVQIAPNAAAAALPGDPAMAAAVALDLAAPTGLSPGLLPSGVAAEEMGAEGPEQRPAGLTDSTPSIDSMPPVTASMAGQGGSAANLRAPLAPSDDLPSHLLAVLQAAGYRPATSVESPDGAEAAIAAASARATAGSAPGADAAPAAMVSTGNTGRAATVSIGDAGRATTASTSDAITSDVGVAFDAAVAFESPAPAALAPTEPATVAIPTAMAAVAVPVLDADAVEVLFLYSAANSPIAQQEQANPVRGDVVAGPGVSRSVPAQTEPPTVVPVTVRDGVVAPSTVAGPSSAGATGMTNAARSEIGTEPAGQGTGQVGVPSNVQPPAGIPAGGQPAPMHVTVGAPDALRADAPQAAFGTYPANPYLPVVATLESLYETAQPRSGGLARDAAGLAWQDAPIVSYAERRPVPIDLAPAPVAVAAWRLDDTQALVTVRQDGSAVATARAGQLYRALLDERGGLAAIRPGEGFVTWDGSPLWLSLAGIGKPAALGVLLALTGRIQIMRTEHGDWLVEHAGGPWPAALATRHPAWAGDDEALLLDVLYGIASVAPAALPCFEDAAAAVRFAGAAPGPAAWRAQEAWALVARCCALLAAQPKIDATPAFQALRIALGVVMDGPAPVPRVSPLTREDCIAAALSGDPAQLSIALNGLGQATLARACRGDSDGIGLLEALGLAVCLGRLTGGMTGRSSHLPPFGVGVTGHAALPASSRPGRGRAAPRPMPGARHP